jgi:lysophospholipase L1-like esterase
MLLFYFGKVKAVDNYNFLGLGDSVTSGFGISDNKDYISIVNEYLKDNIINKTVILDNKAVNGLTSKGLLNTIKNNDNIKGQIKQSDLIILSIGGNDYLSELITSIGSLENEQKFVNIGNDLLMNTKDIYDNIFSLNKDVVLIVIPLYNPYVLLLQNNHNLIDIYNKTKEDFVNQVNEYRNNSNRNIYIPVNLIKELESTNNLNTGIDPHPNANGHKLIAEECIKILNDKIVRINNIEEDNIEKDVNFIFKYRYYLIIVVVIIIAIIAKRRYNLKRK